MWPFRKNPKKNEAIIFGTNPIEYRREWSPKRMPDPGAQNFAYETYALSPLSVISRAVAIRGAPPRLTEKPLYAGQTAILDGVPTTAGQTVQQPLFNRNTQGYVSAYPVPLSPLAGINIVAMRADPIPTNAVDPWDQR